jgi:hypothetical protein
MRKIALLAVVAFAAACGSSTTDPGSGLLRVANLSPSVAAIDYCIKAAGGTYSAPVMAGLGAVDGLVYGGEGEKMIGKYVTYTAGSYTIGVYNKGLLGASCANPGYTLDITIANGVSSTVALIGQTGVTGGAVALRQVTDASVPDATRVLIRFMNTGFLQVPPMPSPSVLPAFDIGYLLLGGNYTVLFNNVVYPSFAAAGNGVDANGYNAVNPSILGSGTTLFSCAHGISPGTVPGACQEIQLPTGAPITGGIIASAFTIGNYGTDPVFSLFCGDNQPPPLAGYPYSLCVTNTFVP